MILEKLLMPDFIFGSYKEVTPEFCRQHGIRALLCDIDNTLVTYDDPEPTPELLEWFGKMKDGGVSVAFVSNNHPERVERFNSSLGYPAYPDAKKPSPRFYAAAADALGVKREEAAVLGDQLLTDAAAAHRFGVAALIVPPIKDKRSLFFRAKRLIERPYMKRAEKTACVRTQS